MVLTVARWSPGLYLPSVPTSPKKLTFLLRSGSTLALWTLLLTTIFTGLEIGFFFLISSIALIALYEYYTMLDAHGVPNFKLFGILCGALLICGSFWQFRTHGLSASYDFEVAVMLFFLLAVFARQLFHGLRDPRPLETMAYTLFGILWIAWMFNFITKILYVVPRGAEGEPMGHFYVLFLIVVTKFSDMGAYLTGSIFGKHLLVPHISPKKTWEGFIGALAFSLLGSYGIFTALGEHLPGLTWTHATILGLLLGFAAVIGDLAESLVKRSTEVKDSGRMLPGIGGALDLIDSLLFTAPLLFFYLRLVMRMS